MIVKNFFIGLTIPGLTYDHNMITPTKEIAVFYDIEFLYNIKKLSAPWQQNAPKYLFLCMNSSCYYIVETLFSWMKTNHKKTNKNNYSRNPRCKISTCQSPKT